MRKEISAANRTTANRYERNLVPPHTKLFFAYSYDDGRSVSELSTYSDF